jgi:transposase-like protein
MAARPVRPDDREQWPKLRRWWFGWRRKTGLRYRHIQGALANLGHVLAHDTIARILKRHGIEPAPERSRKTTWKEFLSRHW